MATHPNRSLLSPSTAELARGITQQGSRTCFLIVRWLVDRGMTDDAYRTYAYFRWLDDTIDNTAGDRRARLALVRRQRQLLHGLLNGADGEGLIPQERILADLLRSRRDNHPGLEAYLTNMMAVMEFDVARRGRLINAEELETYTRLLAVAVMGALTYFIGHDHTYPDGPARLRAVQGAHIAHMLRDTMVDVEAGYFNVPRQFLESQRLSPADVTNPAYLRWVGQRVELARGYLAEGKGYIRSTGHARFRLATSLYCSRFEAVLRRIELDRYLLRSEAAGRANLSSWLNGISRAQHSPAHLARRSLDQHKR